MDIMKIDNRTLCWIWIQSVLGAGSSKVRLINENFGSPIDFYNLGYQRWCDMHIFTQNQLKAMRTIPPELATEIAQKCVELGYTILTPDMPDFPQRLLNLSDYPAALYVWGDISGIDNEVAIAIVGSRSCSPYGQRVAGALAHSLAKAGAIVVSGGALGIDTCAHKGALMGNGKTICVLGCGINTNYLSDNAELRHVISQNGAVISEYPPGTPPFPHNFPIRNRLMSGLSLGTVVAEAAAKSGSLITAKLAADQGRDVFAVPGSVLSEYSKGCNRLISEGAKAVLCANDVLEEYINLYPHKITMTGTENRSITNQPQNRDKAQITNNDIAAQLPLKTINKSKPKSIKKDKNNEAAFAPKIDVTENLSNNAKTVFSILQAEPMHMDDIAAKTNLDILKLSSALTELELNRLIKSYPSHRYGLIK